MSFLLGLLVGFFGVPTLGLVALLVLTERAGKHATRAKVLHFPSHPKKAA